MKKLAYLFLSLIMVAVMVSCTKEATSDDDAMLKGAVTYGKSTPVTAVTPYIIPGANPGGNRTCAEVAAYFSTKEVPVHFDLCGDKIDYYQGAFTGVFPEGLVVNTDGKFVSFSTNGCLFINGNYYKVGAVIVKGSNAANVYFYPTGTNGDSGLAAPLNYSGQPSGLSNLTFCFVECETQTNLVVGFKAYMNGGSNWVTTGAFITSYPLTLNASYKLYLDYWGGEQEAVEVGNLIITDLYPTDGYWEITVDNYLMPDMHFTQPFLYVGPVADFNTDFHNYPYPLSKAPIDPTDTWRFTLNF